MTRLILLALALPACLIESRGHDVPVGPDDESIDTGADITHQAGVDAGYYLSYSAGGRWHIDWTCDTKLSDDGCEFSGTIHAPALAAATCFQCEDNDSVRVAGDDVSFDMLTSTGLDGVELTATPGATVSFDLSINGIYQPDLVFIPSRGVETPVSMPIAVTPTAP